MTRRAITFLFVSPRAAAAHPTFGALSSIPSVDLTRSKEYGHGWPQQGSSPNKGTTIMLQTPTTLPHRQGKEPSAFRKSSAFIYVGVFFGILLCVALTLSVSFALSAVFGRHTTTQTAAAIPPQHVHVSLNIIINQPGMKKDWPAYRPSELVVPANSLVTVTIKDTDLGDTLLPKNAPFASAQGVVGGLAYADGQTYSSLSPDKIAHTFTISQLHVNVPLPGDAKNGATSDTITFTFHTGKAGTYLFQCFDPCGQGPSGWEGSMSTKGYMMGTLIVQ